MTPKQFEDLYKMVSASVNNGAKLGNDVEKNSKKLDAIILTLNGIISNQEAIYREIQKLKPKEK